MELFIGGIIALVIEAFFKCDNIAFVVLTGVITMAGHINMVAYLLKRDICDMIKKRRR